MLIFSTQMARCSSLHQILLPQTTTFVHWQGKTHAQQLIRACVCSFVSQNSPLCCSNKAMLWCLLLLFCHVVFARAAPPTAGLERSILHWAAADDDLPSDVNEREALACSWRYWKSESGEECMNTGTVYWACNTLKRMLTSSISIQSMPELLEMFHGSRGVKSSIW